MTDFALQRTNMVESQVRPSDVTDRRIPRAMLAVPRELFVPEAMRSVAYSEGTLRLGRGPGAGHLLAPRLLAKLLQALNVDADAVVLDIAGGSGYAAALLARMARSVVALETEAQVSEAARKALAAAGAPSVVVVTGPLARGAPEKAPFDAILVNGAVEWIPDVLLDQLKDGGRLAAVDASGGVGRATVWQRSGTQFDARAIFDAEAPALSAFARAREFVL